MKRTEIYWRPLWTVGLEHLTLTESEDGPSADGVVLVHFEGQGLHVRYRVACDPAWRVRTVEAEIEGGTPDGSGPVRRFLSADGHGGWLDGAGKLQEHLVGCIDVDIMATPFTNTLPIRRLEWVEGETQEINVVYIKIPDLRIERASQRYTLLGSEGVTARYLYESIATDFKAELLVDADGVVIDYKGIWERVNLP